MVSVEFTYLDNRNNYGNQTRHNNKNYNIERQRTNLEIHKQIKIKANKK